MKLIYALLLSAIAMPAIAHGPTPQKTDQTATLKAAPDAVWKQLSEPCAIKNWHPDVADCQSTDPKKRTLTLKNGSKIAEEVDEILPIEMTISYRIGGEIDIKALPVSSLTGRIKVKANGAGSEVAWLARYYRADTTNEPPKGLDDESALKAVNAYVKAGLSGLDKPEVKK
ncbi:SRPBCC family protein [Methylotenera sp.]|jgi:mxaD protein|uniref:SRPBCC family protein n=1 Tax=Methylotenera sp. TaxID=2051956 RepID=UPI00271C9151|nr:SRPBCC family protein [Methylotenera sp.]MDO9203947.1 SRPBCC family protein [Methylotenera sp.]MDO9393964.1 SRPBCC family protein [Methylotenera sp.]MDP1522424.1 SRPBCC family protein [Methylotenera sp.]MDP2072486.1 SRPBCC family protein [Methylotenera sp.]MDP2229517.1 SRPBCC family protein [Methylotenera sp.]